MSTSTSGEVIYVCEPLPVAARGWDDTWKSLGRMQWNSYRREMYQAEEEAAPDAVVLPFRRRA